MDPIYLIEGQLYSRSPLFRRVDLPEELCSEPFGERDNGRAEIIVSRPEFLFELHPEHILVSIHDRFAQFISHCSRPWLHRLQRRKTNMSVLSVYDTYGFLIACAYLERLASLSARGYHTEIEAYLTASLRAMDVDPPHHGHLTVLINMIATELLRREEMMPVVTNPDKLVQVNMPPELVARITCSMRLSKAVTQLTSTR